MSSSLIPRSTDALIGLLAAALPALEVRDGAITQNEERAALLIGSGLNDSDFTWEQRWAGLAHAARNETFEIPCTLWVRTGDARLKASRDEVFVLFATVEAALRATPDLGLGSNSVRAQVAPRTYSQPLTASGAVCRLDFVVNVEGRI